MLRRILSASVPGVLAFFIGGAGCIVIGSGNSSSPKVPPPAAMAGGKGDVCAVDPREYTVTIDEISAAARLNFDQSRVDILKPIAMRRGLSPAEQEYLACTALHRLDFEQSKSEVLKTLIANPDFSYRAKGMILRHLNALSFDSTRTDIMRAMQGKGDQPAMPAKEPVTGKDARQSDDT